jgi:radical SAM superfamily enzyme
MRRCPKCNGAVLSGECINCGWAGATREGAANEVTQPRQPKADKPVEAEQKQKKGDERRQKYHKAYQERHQDKVKEWHNRSYARRKDKKGANGNGKEGQESATSSNGAS